MSSQTATSAAQVPAVALPYEEEDERASEVRRRAINESRMLDPMADAAPLEDKAKEEKGERARGSNRRRIIVCLFVLVVLAAVSLVGIYYAFGSSAAKSGPKLKVTADPNKGGQQISTDEDKYAAAINSLATSTKPGETNPLAASQGQPNRGSGLEQLGSETGLRNETQGQAGTEGARAGDGAGQQPQSEGERAPAPTNSTKEATSQMVARLAGRDNSTSARSLPFSALARISSTSTSAETRAGESNSSVSGGGAGAAAPAAAVKQSVAVPPFGAMLPVRSLGMIYTLRSSGGLVRFELTRAMSGRGWSLAKGTIVIGTLRGSEVDRAYISILGFIDTESGGLVKVTGDVLGGDGASGVRGRKKQVSSAFSRVFKRLGEAGLGVINTMAAGVGRGTVIVTDAYTRGVAPVTSEITGVLGNKSNEFVEVKAGTICYVMITQLPGEVEGVDALARMSSQSLNALADSGQPRPSTGLSEMELAELISRGVPSEIRAALPRMTPDMRRVAEAVLQDAGGK